MFHLLQHLTELHIAQTGDNVAHNLKNGVYFPIQRYPEGLCNGDTVCLL